MQILNFAIWLNVKDDNKGLFGWIPHFIPSCMARDFTEIVFKKHFQKIPALWALCVYYYLKTQFYKTPKKSPGWCDVQTVGHRWCDAQTVGHPIPMPIVRPVLISKAMGICLIFCKQYLADPHCFANQNKPNNRHWNWVAHPLYNTTRESHCRASAIFNVLTLKKIRGISKWHFYRYDLMGVFIVSLLVDYSSGLSSGFCTCT